MIDFVPIFVREKILSEYDRICEIRLRANLPIQVTYLDGEKIKKEFLNATLTNKQIEDCVMKLCGYSLFSVEEGLKRGYITSKDGERVGVCGEVVYDVGGRVGGIKDFSSLCVRYPSESVGCSDEFFDRFVTRNSSCLVFSPPFEGKTTFIRDLARNYSEKFGLNVLIIDERDELALPDSNLGKTCDVLRYSSKKFGFECGVRTLNPDVIVTDELSSDEDLLAVSNCSTSGVKCVASIHANKIENIVKRLNKSGILETNPFDYFVSLTNFRVETVYNARFCEL